MKSRYVFLGRVGAAGLTFLVVSTAFAAGFSNTLLPKGSLPARSLDVVDLQSSPIDTKLAAITLQGLVNRQKKANAYLTVFPVDVFWLEELTRKHYIDRSTPLTVDAYFNKYAKAVRQVIVYDPELPATINVAMMMGSLDRGMVVAPADLERHNARRRVVDLRGRWKTNTEAYTWAFNNLWPRMNHLLLAIYHPSDTNHHLRDYLVRNKVFTLWVTGKNAQDGVKSDYEQEKAVLERVLAASPDNIPIIGWWGGTGKDDGMTEYGGVGLAGEYGKMTVACNWQANLSLLSGIPVDVNKIAANYATRPRPPAPTLDKSKVYLSFVIIESGDAPAYWAHVQKNVWEDPKRGSIPIGWSFGPALLEMMPSVAEWFFERIGPNDHLFLAPSGPYYTHPYRNYLVKTREPEAAWKRTLALTQRYMDLLNIRDLSLYTDAWIPFDRAARDATTQRFTNGLKNLDSLILGMGRDDAITEKTPQYFMGDNRVLVSHVFTRWDAANVGRNEKNIQWLADEIKAHTPAVRPAFMHVHPLSWSYHPSDLVAVLDKLGPEYVVISPTDFRAMILQTPPKQ